MSSDNNIRSLAASSALASRRFLCNIEKMIKNKDMCGADGRHDMQPYCNSQSAYCIYPFGFLDLIHMLTSWPWLLASKMAFQLSRSIRNLCAEFDLPFMNYAHERHVQCTDGRQYAYRVAFTFDLWPKVVLKLRCCWTKFDFSATFRVGVIQAYTDRPMDRRTFGVQFVTRFLIRSAV